MTRAEKSHFRPQHVTSRQWMVAVGLLVFILGGGGLAAYFGGQGTQNIVEAATNQATARLAVASVSPPNSASSSWYCNWYLPGKSGITKADILLANTSSKEVVSQVISYSGSTVNHRVVKIPPHSFLKYPETVTPSIQWGSASFVSNGGGTVAETELTGSSGTAVAPCNSSPSANWVVLGAVTRDSSRSGISIFNPFNQNAVVDISLSSQNSQFAPGAFQGVVVASRSTQLFNLTQYFSGKSNVAVSVHTRIGRVVVGGVVNRSDKGNSGLAALSTSPSPTSYWRFPVGQVTSNQNQNLLIYNPNPYKVEASLKLTYLDLTAVQSTVPPVPDGSTTSAADQSSAQRSTTTSLPDSKVAASVSVGAHSVGVVSIKSETSIRPGISYQAVVRVVNGHGVVAAETFTGISNNPNVGYQVMGGLPLVASHWIALYDPSAMGLSTTNAWLATVDTGRFNPVSQKTPLIDLGPTYLAPSGKAAKLPTLQAELAPSSKSVISAKKHLHLIGQLTPSVTGLIVSSRAPFALGTSIGAVPSDLYVVPVFPFAT